MGSRKARARRKNVHTKVRVGKKKPVKPPATVVLPGTEQQCVCLFVRGPTPCNDLTRCLCLLAARTPWEKGQTVVTNYKALGLALDPNGAHGRTAPLRKAAAKAAEPGGEPPTLGAQAEADEEEMRIATGGHLPKGHRPPRRLTATQLRVMRGLVEVHGDDVKAMARDQKRNAMQHTASTLRTMLDDFHAQDSSEMRVFRAPIKRL